MNKAGWRVSRRMRQTLLVEILVTVLVSSGGVDFLPVFLIL
ncbi:MAG: hypothetical protein UY61_C0008G0009 [Candidatus Adlerbacteria bacterium GW2011_GWC1_50_9]|uniref:Uncharacterized protein n=1 Tax=Candidatus Adlerbacteria bacterium GW2011_GWC1_50_9 TaxID=1618608 RepID=A0A0G1Z1Z8_9BACT|nr:MAG: hypothetical protein UY61_C0008G0009 [Candidatus Adlerbacteria bacterium GW2011_GWC1_50_9]